MSKVIGKYVAANSTIKVMAQPNEVYSMVDSAQKPLKHIAEKRINNDLLLINEEQHATLVVQDFFNTCNSLDAQCTVLPDSPASEVATVNSALHDNSTLLDSTSLNSMPAKMVAHTAGGLFTTTNVLVSALGLGGLGAIIKSQQYSNSDLPAATPAVNYAPIAQADNSITNEDQMVQIAVLANDTDVDGDPLTIVSASAAHGSVSINADGTLSYTPASHYSGTDTISYSIDDNHGHTVVATVAITVNAINHAPVALNDSAYLVVNSANDTETTVISGNHNLVNGLGGSAGFGENALAVDDDNSSNWLNITSVFANGINFYGKTYTGFYINNNGNVSFNAPLGEYIPSQITSATSPFIAPFWGDVDTRAGSGVATAGGYSTGSNRVWLDFDSANHVITITWDDVGMYYAHNSALNAFQVQLFDLGNGDFDMVYRYENINWAIADNAHLNNGTIRVAQVAHAGWSSGNGADFYEIPQSGSTAMLDLENTIGNTGIAGVWKFSSRSGAITAANSISIDVLHNDTDIDADNTLSITTPSVVSGGGTVSVMNNQLVYTPDATDSLAIGEHKDVILQYAAMDNNQGISNVATVAVRLIGAGYNHYVVGDSANNTLATTTQNDYLLGNGGQDTFVVSASGQDVIGDFNPSTSILNLSSIFAGSRFNDAMSHATQTGKNTVFDFGTGNSLTLNNVMLGDLISSHVIL